MNSTGTIAPMATVTAKATERVVISEHSLVRGQCERSRV